jgi:hypothetical protein
MKHCGPLSLLALSVMGCPSADPDPALVVTSVTPGIVDPQGGSHLVITGTGFTGRAGDVTEVRIGGVATTSFVIASDTELRVVAGPVSAGVGLDVEVVRGRTTATLAGAIEAWSPAEMPGARVFDAASGVETGASDTHYEWQRMTASIGEAWRVRDGSTLTWLPSTGRFWMVGGWNGYQEPVGFSHDPPDTTYPPQNTTNEVWSSPDGVTWTVELGPGTTPPPWTPRALQVSGVYDGKLWTAGGQDLLGPPDEHAYHNDVWSTSRGCASDPRARQTLQSTVFSRQSTVRSQGELAPVGFPRPLALGDQAGQDDRSRRAALHRERDRGLAPAGVTGLVRSGGRLEPDPVRSLLARCRHGLGPRGGGHDQEQAEGVEQGSHGRLRQGVRPGRARGPDQLNHLSFGATGRLGNPVRVRVRVRIRIRIRVCVCVCVADRMIRPTTRIGPNSRSERLLASRAAPALEGDARSVGMDVGPRSVRFFLDDADPRRIGYATIR